MTERTGTTPDASQLTARQRSVLSCIQRIQNERGYPPSISEIANAVGLSSSSSAAYQLKVLQRKGYLYRDPVRARALVMHDPGGPDDRGLASAIRELVRVHGGPQVAAAVDRARRDARGGS